jgi:hypothetical protein
MRRQITRFRLQFVHSTTQATLLLSISSTPPRSTTKSALPLRNWLNRSRLADTLMVGPWQTRRIVLTSSGRTAPITRTTWSTFHFCVLPTILPIDPQAWDISRFCRQSTHYLSLLSASTLLKFRLRSSLPTSFAACLIAPVMSPLLTSKAVIRP